MKKQNCNLCGSSEKSIEITQDFEDTYLNLIDPKYNELTRYLCRCLKCGHLYRDPVLDANDLEILYTKFRDMGFRSETPDQYFDRINSLPIEGSENSEKLNWIKMNMGDDLVKTKSMLDIGCGGGVFLAKFMNEYKNFKFYGIEPTPCFAQLAAKRLAIPINQSEYSRNIFDMKFDLITANQVLEHVLDPIEFMSNIYADLTEKGFVYLEVPDVSDLLELEPTHDRFLMQHVSIFSEDSMRYLIKTSGFEIRKIEVLKTIRGRNNLVCLVTKG